MFVLLFTRLALQGIVCYTFLVYCRAVMSLPCVERKTQASRDCLWQLEVARVSETEGLLKTKLYRKTIPQSPSVTAPFTQGSLIRAVLLRIVGSGFCPIVCGRPRAMLAPAPDANVERFQLSLEKISPNELLFL